ncbi:MAG: PKD domain-containing protein, partial [Bacteroidota bacterium]|nr:PKD domain-containing protein [Bacteroidota bacterium]
QVEVGDDSLSADFNDVLTVVCDSNQVILRAPFVLPTTQYNWDLGDGTTSSDSVVVHSYLNPGTYSVSLALLDSNSCSLTDSFTTDVTIPTSPLASINLLDTVGCAPITIDFTNSSTNFSDVLWDFGTGDTSILLNPIYTFQDSGSFQIQLIAYDSSGCIPSDTAIATVQTRIDSFLAEAQIDTLLFDCDELQIQGSSLNSGVLRQWLWGNGNTSTDSSTTNIYGPGIYTASYIASDPSLLCGRPDTLFFQFEVRPKIEATFSLGPVCDEEAIQPVLTSGSFNAIEWRFGDGSTSNLESPSHIYGGPGMYEVILTLTDSTSCNIQDADTLMVEIYGNPRADFSLDSSVIEYGSLVTLTNLSQDYDGLVWDLGDGNVINDDEVIEYLYERFGEIQPCLQAVIDGLPCADTLCKSITIEVNPLLGMPNAFTPNGDGLNDTAYVEGRHIADLSYRIYNRWGELVFESNDINLGWDGRFRGVLQEQEVYVYVVEARFIDNSRQVLRGNLTLIR